MRPCRSPLARLLIAGCAAVLGCTAGAGARGPNGAADAPATAAVASPAAAVSLHVLLVAVGDEQPVFDRFVGDLSRRLQALDVASLATASSSGAVGRKFDTPADLYAAIRGLRAQRPGGCLVYLTGHGTRAGLSMPLAAVGGVAAAASAPAAERRYAALRVRDVQAALRDGCGDAPTVLVASACYSGVYLRPGVVGDDRIVLTAAAPDRTSFGCGNDETYTYYDGCFLRSLDGASTWQQLAGRTSTCVAQLERTLQPDSPRSNPQAFFGRRMRELPLPAGR